ncbi:mitochondrial ribosomal small subunit component [Dispira parvispora]|uniref:Small ribosomal subunit protein mS23 n=1 Tax=Dispira parvispora TaxID=1520584 RepID=A0A9W8DZ77_9FUNG|nr:mitochondrial ribosomal small subunit component [Dispira parvispora]
MTFRKYAKNVHQHMTNLLKTQVRVEKPAWYNAVEKVPPGPTLVRDPSPFATCSRLAFEKGTATPKSGPQALESELKPARYFVPLDQKPRTVTRRRLRTKPPKPPHIVFPEDRLRRRFYKDHPHELLRPRALLEPWQGPRTDWSRLQDTRHSGTITGEDVIRHQLYLMTECHLSEQEAYAQVLKEFYRIRAREDLETKLAEEQAHHFGAQPLLSDVDMNLKMEERQLEKSNAFLEEREALRRMQTSATEKSFIEAEGGTVS